MQTITMTITPAQAKLWLDTKNTKNRTVSHQRAEIYASDMRSGNWHLTHQGIAFYEDGVIADGQTRLKAITLAKKDIEMQVTFGLPVPAAIGIDVHRMRTTSNQISISGASTWAGDKEVSVARMIRRASEGLTENVSTTELVRFCEFHKDAIVFSCQHLSTTVRNVTPAPIKSAVARAFYHEDKTRLAEFCRVLVSGLMESKSDIAAIRLRERLMQDGPTFYASSTGRVMAIRLATRAIKAFCERQELGKLVVVKEEIYTPPSMALA